MTALAVTVEFDGKQTPVADLSWFLTMPCGCIVGATIVDHHDGYILTEDAAWAQFYELSTAACSKQDRARGLDVVLAHRSRVLEMTTDCPHEPRWGGVEPAKPDGYAWMVTSLTGGGAQHYLPEDTETAGNQLDDVRALCGTTAKRWDWHPAKAAWKHRHDCTRCLKAAAPLGGAA